MKTAIYCLATVGALVLSAGHGLAQSTNAWFVEGGVGPAFTQDSSIHASAFGNSGQVKFDTGLRGGITVGYQLKPCLAAALETGVAWNDVRSIAGNTPDQGASADLYQVPFLAKLIYTPFHGAFQPYLGAGCGGAASFFNMSHVSSSSSLGLYAPDFNGSDCCFAYQLEAGVHYQIAKNLSLGLGYQFLGTTDHDWTDHGVELKTGGVFTHAVEVSLTWNF